MQSLIVFAGLLCLASAGVFHPAAPVVRAASEYISPATTLVRSPADDSAHIEHRRLGGSFAYSVAEAPAFKAINPVIRKEVVETGVSYSALPPVVTRTVEPQPAQVIRNYETVVPEPIVTKHVAVQPALKTVAYAEPFVKTVAYADALPYAAPAVVAHAPLAYKAALPHAYGYAYPY